MRYKYLKDIKNINLLGYVENYAYLCNVNERYDNTTFE